MTSTLPIAHRAGWLSLAILATCLTGCQSMNLPQFSFLAAKDPKPKYVGVEPGFETSAAEAQEVYHKVREAEAQNSIVLQVVGDDPPLRVLPLPPAQKSVFISDLLTQTGVQEKIGALEAVLIRQSPGSPTGVKMDVLMAGDKRSVRPESDYALQAGDRLRVQKAPTPGLEELLKMAVGL